MATYVGRYRTNYFSVKNEDAFSEWLEKYVNGAEVKTLPPILFHKIRRSL